VLFGAGAITLYSVNYLHASDVLGSWPVFYYAVFVIFFPRALTKPKSPSRISSKRILFSCFVAFLFAGGIILTVAMNIVSFNRVLAEGRGVLLLFANILLALFAWVRMSADELSASDKPNEDMRSGWHAKWYQPAVLVIPYLSVVVFSITTGRTASIMHCSVLLAALALAVWTRYVFRRMSGTKWLAAIMFSIIYSLIAFS
jgi:hypothetical protein